MTTRRLGNWLDGFMQYTADLPTSPIFRKWTGLFLLATALERKVWLNTMKTRKLFANLQVILVANPGIGKTVLTSTIADFHAELPEHKRASNDISKASFVDELNEAKRSVGVQGVDEEANFNSLLVLSNELGALLPAYDAAFLNLLTELYDCHSFKERRRHRKQGEQIDIPRPQVNLFCATTPSQLKELMPEGAWDQGFAARTFFIYESEPIMTELFAETTHDRALQNNLITDLQSIGELHGSMALTESALNAARKWHSGGGQPVPQHPRLQHYLTRRTSMHVIKLAMLTCIAEGDDFLITEAHFNEAKRILLEAEQRMPYMFRSMVGGGDRQIIVDVWFAAHKEANGAVISHQRIYNLVQDRTTETWKVPGLISSLVRMGALRPAGGSSSEPDYRVAKFKNGTVH